MMFVTTLFNYVIGVVGLATGAHLSAKTILPRARDNFSFNDQRVTMERQIFKLVFMITKTFTTHVTTVVEIYIPDNGDSGLESRASAVGINVLTMQHPLSSKVGTNFADKLQSIGRYSAITD
jgi:hypothetical protein